MWRRGSCERISRSGQEELRKGDQLFIERDKELAEMSSQFAELQTLFDEVTHQLYTECKRIKGVRSPIRCCYRSATHERGERIRTEHSKEKLQSLTPQMLLTRLSLANTRAFPQGVDKLLNANMR